MIRPGLREAIAVNWLVPLLVLVVLSMAVAGVAGCKSDPDPRATGEQELVAARFDRVRIERSPRVERSPVEKRTPAADADTPEAESARLEAMRAKLETPPESNSSAGATDGGSGSSADEGGGEGSGAGDGEGAGEGTGEGSSDAAGEGGSEGSGGGSGSGGTSDAASSNGGASTPPGTTGTATSGSGTSGSGGTAAGDAPGAGEGSLGGDSESGVGEGGSGGIEGSIGGPSVAAGAGVGDTGSVDREDAEYAEGVGGASSDAARGGDGDPGFIEPQAMPGAGVRLPGGGAETGGGSGEAAEHAGGGLGGGGRSDGGRHAGGASGGEDSGSIDASAATPSGTIEVDPLEENLDAGDEDGDDFLDAPIVLDLPRETSAESPDEPHDADAPAADPTTEGGTPRDEEVPSRGEPRVDGVREDAAIEGAIGQAGRVRDRAAPDDPDDPGDFDDVPPDADRSPDPPAGQGIGDAVGDPLGDPVEIPLRERLAMPEVDLEAIDTTLELREARSNEAPRDDPAWLLRGAWEQVDRDRNGPDFAPGGYDRNVIAIDPREGTLEVYRAFRGGLVLAGAFGVEILPEGTLLLVADDRLPHRFPAQRLELANGVVVEPPIEPADLDRRWKLEDGVLEIAGRRFARIDREAFERISRGDPRGDASSRRSSRDLDGGTAPIAEDGRPSGEVEEAAASVDFFGTSIVGRYVCYVVDVSGSMAGPRLAAALEELSRSIRALPPDRSFYVLFFSGGKLVLEDRWQRATSGRKRAFTSRFVDIEAQGGTQPEAALEHAFTSLAPVPDEIHFMTDGQIPTNTPGLLRSLNGGRIRTVIHTYAFGNASGGTLLERIAAEHGGTYRFVPDRP